MLNPRSGLAWLASVAAAGFLWGSLQTPESRITFLDVGQGDCAVIQAGGRTILVDTGPTSPTYDLGQRVLLPKLRSLGIQGIDLILLSHPDLDHVGGTPAVLRRFPAARLAVSAAFASNTEMNQRLAEWHVPADRVAWLNGDSQATIGELSLFISCPPGGTADNDASMFVRVGRPGAEAVLSGDAPNRTEAWEADHAEWRAQLMKAGHHGSRTSSGSTWMQEVRPNWVVVSCGRDNRYGHPHRETLQRVAAFGAQLLRTDHDGDISFVWKTQGFARER